MVFRTVFGKVSSPRDLFLPILTLPFAITLFGLMVWACRIGLGVEFTPAQSPREDLQAILSTYLMFGCMTFMTPSLYGLAIVTQLVLKSRTLISEGAVSQRRPNEKRQQTKPLVTPGTSAACLGNRTIQLNTCRAKRLCSWAQR